MTRIGVQVVEFYERHPINEGQVIEALRRRGKVAGALSPVSVYKANIAPPNIPMNASSITPQGGSQPHDNMQPFLCINFIISLFGIYPSPN